MATVPVPKTFAPSELLTANTMNTEVRDTANFLLNPPRAKVRAATAQSIPTAVETLMNWDTEFYDNDGLFVIGSPTRLTVQTEGLYVVHAHVALASNATGARRIMIFCNNTLLAASSFDAPATSGQRPFMAASVDHYASAGQYFEVKVAQYSGVALDTYITSWTPSFSARWVAA